MSQDEKRELPNMTATEALNAKQPPYPVHGIISDMVERETQLLGLDIQWKRLTPAECLKLWAKRD